MPAGYPSDADIEAAYAASQQAFAAPAQYRISQIFISAPYSIDLASLAAAVPKAADISSKITTADFNKLAVIRRGVHSGAIPGTFRRIVKRA